MANAAASKLRDQARAAENKDNWREAANLYRQVLEESPAEEVDIALWNRVGDLHLRVNETDRAVEAYEHAVNAYTDSGLYNNAIALCRKILRAVPGRAAIYHRLGQISAAAGFVADARQNFLEYAERMKRAGRPDDSFEALREFADLSQDVEVRRLLADQLLSHGKSAEAVEQMRILLGAAEQRGDEDSAAHIRDQIRAIDPEADVSPLLRDRTTAVDEFRHALHDGTRLEPLVAGLSHGAGVAAVAGLEPTSVVDAPLAGLESTALDTADSARGGVDTGGLQIEHTSLDLPEFAGGMDADDLGSDLLDAEDRASRLDAGETGEAPRFGHEEDESLYDLPAMDGDDGLLDEDEDGGELPLMDFGEGSAGTDLPLLSFGDEPPAPRAPEPVDPLPQLREQVAAAPADADARDALVRELRARGLGHEVDEVLENAHRALAAQGMYLEAVAPITALIGLRPGDPLLLQKRVEYAFRSGRPEPQVEAYLGLARHMAATGSAIKAAAVFRRVLELDPHNVEARQGAAAAGPPLAAPAAIPAPPPPAPVAPPRPAAPPAPEYVDLGALIMDEEEGEPTTRFIVEEREPSGDEDRDFSEMLASFRQKVAENIEVEDSASHYDLGVAFMEMGLVDEAIAEFQVALRGGSNPLATLEVLGQCFVDKQQYAVAGRVLDRALKLPTSADGDLVGVLYLLGRIQESTGRPEHALEYYERVVSVDIRFRDTSARVERLRRERGAA
ncbi:tetratricopeptide repeat protein [Longimicrobium terrae]|uniref:Tetratricopeptide (TPR) repeat protein n=1 Tax=Longimicrobium terrae TaxID=1639882 RepID=A0A841GUQ6_9BACT|nr:tetratricopeptide repeat protein [Longimicrobium terrae]MBB4634317.1 tetratricopeptide (TPR) repeat protein [Longimicrobium terrae]MBB6068793.1 tetratricopeptide (TPR) repeat protein [Longimicrobium terrae]NNC27978.1 tetratricopeptide repeat protein [Longimicrobium terrae]